MCVFWWSWFKREDLVLICYWNFRISIVIPLSSPFNIYVNICVRDGRGNYWNMPVIHALFTFTYPIPPPLIPHAKPQHPRMKHILTKCTRQHNLKNIGVTIPQDKLVVITGVSGSGKPALAARPTLYTEGQRRYVESLSTFAAS